MESQLQDGPRTNDYVVTEERAAVLEVPVEAVDIAERDQSSGAAALFGADEAQTLRSHWEQIQIEFVDEPRHSVEQADKLVEAVAKRLTEMFADQRSRLEREWAKGEISTEELRTAFRRYRTLFDRLLSM